MLATQHITTNPPYNQRVKTSYKKNNLWIMTKWNRWYNIGITPIRDYINHSNTYPRITATIKPLHNT